MSRASYVREISLLLADLQAILHSSAREAARRAGTELKLFPLPDFASRAEEMLEAEIASMAGRALVAKLKAEIESAGGSS